MFLKIFFLKKHLKLTLHYDGTPENFTHRCLPTTMNFQRKQFQQSALLTLGDFFRHKQIAVHRGVAAATNDAKHALEKLIRQKQVDTAEVAADPGQHGVVATVGGDVSVVVGRNQQKGFFSSLRPLGIFRPFLDGSTGGKNAALFRRSEVVVGAHGCWYKRMRSGTTKCGRGVSGGSGGSGGEWWQWGREEGRGGGGEMVRDCWLTKARWSRLA